MNPLKYLSLSRVLLAFWLTGILALLALLIAPEPSLWLNLSKSIFGIPIALIVVFCLILWIGARR